LSEKSEPAFTLYRLSTIIYYITVNLKHKEKGATPPSAKAAGPLAPQIMDTRRIL